MTIVNFVNGTQRQRDLFKDAMNCWNYAPPPPLPEHGREAQILHACHALIDVVWVPDPGPKGQKEAANTTCWPDELGMRARIEIQQDLDNPQSMFYYGDDFYKECCLHEVGHIAAVRLVEGNAREGAVIALMSPRSSWNNPVWERAVEETVAELLKDSLAYSGQKKFWNRTKQILRNTYDWTKFVDLYNPNFETQSVDLGPLPTSGVVPYREPATLYFHPGPYMSNYGAGDTNLIFFHTSYIRVTDSQGEVIAENGGGSGLTGRNPPYNPEDPNGAVEVSFNGANTGVSIGLYDYDRLPLTYTTWLSGFLSGSGTPHTTGPPPNSICQLQNGAPGNPLTYGTTYAPNPYIMRANGGPAEQPKAIISVTANQ